MVERCVRDAEVASSNLVASMIRPIGQFKSCRLDDPAYWSSGQDAALSRRKPGFDSRIGHERKKHCLMMDSAFFCGAPGGGGRTAYEEGEVISLTNWDGVQPTYLRKTLTKYL